MRCFAGDRRPASSSSELRRQFGPDAGLGGFCHPQRFIERDGVRGADAKIDPACFKSGRGLIVKNLLSNTFDGTLMRYPHDPACLRGQVSERRLPKLRIGTGIAVAYLFGPACTISSSDTFAVSSGRDAEQADNPAAKNDAYNSAIHFIVQVQG